MNATTPNQGPIQLDPKMAWLQLVFAACERWARSPWLNGTRGKIVIALVLDVFDFVLRGALGLKLGFPFGALVGYRLARTLNLDSSKAWKVAVLCGLYCMVPGTARIPLGTVAMAIALLVDARPGSASREPEA